MFRENRGNLILAIETRMDEATESLKTTYDGHCAYFDKVIHDIVHRNMETIESLNKLPWGEVLKLYRTLPEKDNLDIRKNGLVSKKK